MRARGTAAACLLFLLTPAAGALLQPLENPKLDVPFSGYKRFRLPGFFEVELPGRAEVRFLKDDGEDVLLWATWDWILQAHDARGRRVAASTQKRVAEVSESEVSVYAGSLARAETVELTVTGNSKPRCEWDEDSWQVRLRIERRPKHRCGEWLPGSQAAANGFASDRMSLAKAGPIGRAPVNGRPASYYEVGYLWSVGTCGVMRRIAWRDMVVCVDGPSGSYEIVYSAPETNYRLMMPVARKALDSFTLAAP